MSAAPISRSSIQLYRDCLRLVNHVAGKSAKGLKLRQIVGSEFRKNALEKNEEKITQLKSSAIKALANYLMIQSASKDIKFQARAEQYAKSEAETIKK